MFSSIQPAHPQKADKLFIGERTGNIYLEVFGPLVSKPNQVVCIALGPKNDNGSIGRVYALDKDSHKPWFGKVTLGND